MSGIDESRRAFLHTGVFGAMACTVSKQAQGASDEMASTRSGDAQGQKRVEVLTQVLRLNGPRWRVGIDPGNLGRKAKWCEAPRKDALLATVPGVIQSAFPAYHGVAWYWREFTAPVNPHADGRYWLRFHAVDYLGEVWLNGVKLGGHEGAQEPFSLEATAAMKPGMANLLAVRVLNPTHGLIDKIRLEEVAEGRRDYPKPEDNAYNTGGIIDSVELLITPAVRVAALQVVPDWKTGEVRVAVDLHNAGAKATDGELRLTIAPATGGESAAEISIVKSVGPGISSVEGVLHVLDHRLWEINDPCLYRVTARISDVHDSFADECSTTCGFRDLRFEDGYFRFNGRRIHLHGALYTVLQYPVMLSVPYDDDLFRRDMLNMKMLGLNLVRITCGAAVPARMLEVTDELGLLVCEEHFGARELEPSPFMADRWNESVRQVICRDRNHPSVVMWILLNEVFADNKLLRHAAKSLDLVRSLDQTRLVVLNSGGFDRLAGLGAPNGASIVRQATLDNSLLLQPGPEGEYSVVRWTCPESGDYTIAAGFTIYMRRASAETDTGFQVLLNGKSIFDGALKGNEKGPDNASFTLKRALTKGDTIDFAQGPGGAFADPAAAWRRVSGNIRSSRGDSHEMALEFSPNSNPNGVWQYGYFSPGPKPNADTFKLFVVDDPLRKNLGNLSNGGSPHWETHISDIHPYQGFPHTAEIVHRMRSMDMGAPILLSE
jgi:Glycosyl hydrolases family 2, TIM barrel domain/Glycosyl hydrolases family 2, sugar binding domain/Glycosyl hydrolases family 2